MPKCKQFLNLIAAIYINIANACSRLWYRVIWDKVSIRLQHKLGVTYLIRQLCRPLRNVPVVVFFFFPNVMPTLCIQRLVKYLNVYGA